MHNLVEKIKQNQGSKKVISWFSPQKLPLTIIGYGILVRLVQYLSNRSLWNDEAAIALNIVNRSYLELLQPLDHDQGAPPGFLFIEKLAIQLFGNNEYALRLFPFLSAIISLFIFYKLAKRCLQPPSVPIALALFSTLHILVYYASEVKQYSSDVAIALLLCLLLMQMNNQKLTVHHLANFGIAGATTIWFSHPAIFILAGIGTTYLLLSLLTKNTLKTFKLLGIYLTWLLSFGYFYTISLKNIANQEDLFKSWGRRGTFPTSFLDINWLFNTFIEFFHKPLGFPDVFVAVAILAFLTGCISLFYKRKEVLLILLSPIVTTLFAAYLHKYPFDGRLVLFLTPFFILLISEGASSIRHKNTFNFQPHYKKQNLPFANLRASLCVNEVCEAPPLRLKFLENNYVSKFITKLGTLILVLLLVPPIGTAGYLIVKPYLKQEIRPVISYIKKHQQSEDIIYVYQRAEYQFKYYAEKFGYQQGDYVLGIDDLDKKDGQGISDEEWQRYASDLDKLRGNPRVWIVFSHVRSWARESERITSYLDGFGKQIDVFKQEGSFTYLYDLSKF